MGPSRKKFRFYVYGDGLLRRLCPLLKSKLKLDIKDQFTMPKAEITPLHSKVVQRYKRLTKQPGPKDVALIMVGTYEIMYYPGNGRPKIYGGNLCRKLRSFVKFLSKYHKNIIIVGALPVLKKQKMGKYWKVLEMYNRTIDRMGKRFRGSNVSVVDLCPMFLKRSKPRTCYKYLYERFECPPNGADVMWNEAGMEIALNEIREADNDNPPCPLVHFISER